MAQGRPWSNLITHVHWPINGTGATSSHTRETVALPPNPRRDITGDHQSMTTVTLNPNRRACNDPRRTTKSKSERVSPKSWCRVSDHATQWPHPSARWCVRRTGGTDGHAPCVISTRDESAWVWAEWPTGRAHKSARHGQDADRRCGAIMWGRTSAPKPIVGLCGSRDGIGPEGEKPAQLRLFFFFSISFKFSNSYSKFKPVSTFCFEFKISILKYKLNANIDSTIYIIIIYYYSYYFSILLILLSFLFCFST
jgi:hypothetical protein